MGIEQRGNNRYYYQKHREGQRVVSRYLGSGQFAEVAAELDRLTQYREAAERQRWADERAIIEAADAWLDARARLLADLTTAVLEEHGFHRHKGQWRKRREQRSGDSD